MRARDEHQQAQADLRRFVGTGRSRGPRLLVSGPLLSARGGYLTDLYAGRLVRDGAVVEVASAAEFPSFEAFMTALRNTRLTTSISRGTISVDFVTTDGDRMQFSYGGRRLLNGTPVEFAARKLYDSPFVTSDYGSGIVTLSYKNRKRVLDFPSATIREQ